MAKNVKRSSSRLGALASSTLRDPNASRIAKSLAGSIMAQTGTSKETGAELEDLASQVMRSKKYSEETKALAASVLSQSNRRR